MPFLLASPDVLGAQGGRGLHVESLAGGVILLLDNATIVHSADVVGYNVVSDWASGVLEVQWPLMVVVLGGTVAYATWRVYRGADIAPMAIACLLVFMLASRVLSPQFIFWTLSFLLVGWRYLMLFAAIALTLLVFPVLTWALIVEREYLPLLVLNARNALLVGLAIMLLLPRMPELRRNASQ